MWETKKWNKTRSTIIARGKAWWSIEEIIAGKVKIDILSPSIKQQLHSCESTSPSYLTEEGNRILGEMKRVKNIIVEVEANSKKKLKYSHEIVQKFDTACREQPGIRNHLMVQMLEMFIDRASGKKNTHIPNQLMDFYCLCMSFDRRATQVLSGNLMGPSVRAMLQHVKTHADIATTKCLIVRDAHCIKEIIKKRIKSLFPKKGQRIAYSAAIDAAKVAKLLQIDYKYRAIIGGIESHKFVRGVINDDGDESMDLQNLKQLLQDDSIQRADEIKVLVIAFQDTGTNNPYLITAARPQTNNEVSLFNETCSDLCESVAKEMRMEGFNTDFLGTANDGVSCDKDFVVKTLSSFLRGDKSYVGTTDINHNCKNARYQIVGLNSIVTIGKYFIDVGLIKVANVQVDLWKVSDWASDALVLKLASAQISNQILQSDAKDMHSKFILILTFVSLRSHLFAINCRENLDNVHRVKLLWYSYSYFMHLKGVSVVTKRNWTMATISNIFLLMKDNVVQPDRATSEPCEHTFGHARSMSREFTVRDFCNLTDKITRRYDIFFKHNFVQSRDPQKGYNSKSTEKFLLKTKLDGGPIDVFQNKDKNCSHADCIWKTLRPIINECNTKMKKFLQCVVGIEVFHPLMKQFKVFQHDSPTDLLDSFFKLYVGI